MSVANMTADERTWVVAFSRDNGPSSYYVYSRCAGDGYHTQSTTACSTITQLQIIGTAAMSQRHTKVRSGQA